MSGLPGIRPSGDIGCCVCGSHITFSWVKEDTIFLNNEKWEISDGQQKVLFLDAKELESKYIDKDVSGIWATFHRLILYDSSKGQFTLTGIGQYSLNSHYAVPKDATKAFVGVLPEDGKSSTEIYRDFDEKIYWWRNKIAFTYKKTDWRHLPIPIHMSCWKLAQWKLGLGVAENLELFISIALRTTIEFLLEYRKNTAPLNIFEMSQLKNSSFDDMEDKRAEVNLKNIYEWENRIDYDPYRNPWAKSIIDSSRRIKKRITFAQPLIPYLPLEILFEILYFLDCKEISNLGIAFRIVIPDCYWRSRVASNLIEIDEISEEDLSWQYLCLKFKAVYATGEKFESRRYIVDILSNKIEPIYLQNLEKRDFPRLEEVMDDFQDEIKRAYDAEPGDDDDDDEVATY